MQYKSHGKRYSRRRFLSLASAGVIGGVMLTKPLQAMAVEGVARSFVFVDDLGRSIRIPYLIESVTPTGIIAQTILCELCAERITSVAAQISDVDAADYENADMGDLVDLPETGTLISRGDANVDTDAVADISPVIMLDVGLPKEGLADKLNELQLETGIPVVFIDISFGKLPDAYRTLGTLLGCEQRAETLAVYVEAVMSEVTRIADTKETACKVFYAQREYGLAVTGSISLQLDAIASVGAIPVVEPYDYASNQVQLDVLAGVAVDWILFDDTNILESLQQRKGAAWDMWSETILTCDAEFAVSPALFHSWLGSMVFAQSIGLLWLASVVWPASCDYDIEQRAQEFSALFYGLGLADEASTDLVGSQEGEAA